MATLEQATRQARRRAPLLGQCYYVLGPCPIDGYWAAPARLRVELWPDRRPVLTVAPDGRTEPNPDYTGH